MQRYACSHLLEFLSLLLSRHLLVSLEPKPQVVLDSQLMSWFQGTVALSEHVCLTFALSQEVHYFVTCDHERSLLTDCLESLLFSFTGNSVILSSK